MIPNYEDEVAAAIQKYPDAFAHAHVDGDPRRYEFIKLLAKDLRAIDLRVANNGKRGDANNLSMDALNILCTAAESDGRTPDNRPCVVVDVIAHAGARPPYSGSNPAPKAAWGVYKTKVEGSGAHVVPAVQEPDPPPPPPAKTYPGDHVWDAVGKVLFADYARGAQDPNEGMGRWFGRVIWDATEGDETGTVLTIQESITKHRKGWCSVLGIPVV